MKTSVRLLALSGVLVLSVGACVVVSTETVSLLRMPGDRWPVMGGPERGVQVGLTVAADRVCEGFHIPFACHVWNVAGVPIIISRHGGHFGPDAFEVTRLEDKTKIRSASVSVAPVATKLHKLPAKGALVHEVFVPVNLKPGVYSVVWEYHVARSPLHEQLPALWSGRVRSEPVEVEVVPRPASR